MVGDKSEWVLQGITLPGMTSLEKEKKCIQFTALQDNICKTRVGENSGRAFFEFPRCMSLARY